MGGRTRARRPAGADPVRAAPGSARAPARLRGAAAPDPGRRRARQGRSLRQGLRVPRRGTTDPGRGAAGRGGRRPDSRDRRRRDRAARRRRGAEGRTRRAARAVRERRAARDRRSRRRRATGSRAAPAPRSSRSSSARCDARPARPRRRRAVLRDRLHGHVREAAVESRRHAQPLGRPDRRLPDRVRRHEGRHRRPEARVGSGGRGPLLPRRSSPST